MHVDVMKPPLTTGRRGIRYQRAQILYQEVDHDNAQEIRPRTTEQRRRPPSDRSTVDGPPLATTLAVSFPIGNATGRRLFHNSVPASTSVGVASLQNAQASVVFS